MPRQEDGRYGKPFNIGVNGKSLIVAADAVVVSKLRRAMPATDLRLVELLEHQMTTDDCAIQPVLPDRLSWAKAFVAYNRLTALDGTIDDPKMATLASELKNAVEKRCAHLGIVS